jgi:hypothetical protein
MHLPKPTPPHELTGPQLAECLTSLGYRLGDQLDRYAWDLFTEAARRLKQHELLVRDVVPDLRSRIGGLEEALARLVPPG